MTRLTRRILSTGAKAAVTVLLFALLFRKIDYAATLRHLREITPFTGIVGLALVYFGIALATERWRIVLRSIGRRFAIWSLARLNLIGQFFNQTLPSTIGGDGMRVWLLYRHGCTVAEAFNSVLIDRIAGFGALAVMSLYGLPTLVERMFAIPKSETVVGIVAVFIIMLALFSGLVRARTLIARFRGGRFVAQIVADVLFLAARPGNAATIALLSIVGHLAGFVLIWLILRDLGTEVPLLGVVTVAPVVILLLVLPISIAGWGLREGLFVVGFGLLQVPHDVALAASIIYGLIYLVVGLSGGAFWILELSRERTPNKDAHPMAETGLIDPPTRPP